MANAVATFLVRLLQAGKQFLRDTSVVNAIEAPGPQYLDGPRDDVQIMASIGEYGDEWWRSQLT